jgi:hypothetical protein
MVGALGKLPGTLTMRNRSGVEAVFLGGPEIRGGEHNEQRTGGT